MGVYIGHGNVSMFGARNISIVYKMIYTSWNRVYKDFTEYTP